MNKLTYRTFLLLLGLSMAVSICAYGCIWLFLPYIDKNRAQHQLRTETEQLVSDLRASSREDSAQLFWDFGRKTGADLQLLNAAGESISLFTFEKIDQVRIQGAEYPFKFENLNDKNIGAGDGNWNNDKNVDDKNAGDVDNTKLDAENLNEEYILIVRFDSFRTDESVRAVCRSMPYVAAVLLVLSFGCAWIYSYYTTRPIIRINHIAGRMAELDFSWYCPDMREDEIGMLSRSINKLSDRLHEALDELNRRNVCLEDEIRVEKERERRRMLFFSGISHELKTPVAIVIGQLEGMRSGIGVYKDREKYLSRSIEILQSLNQFIKEVLFVSHIDLESRKIPGQTEGAAGDAVADTVRACVPISDLLDQMLEEYSAYAEFYSVQITGEIEGGLFVYGDEMLLQKAVGNIIGNAVMHVPENGQVAVRLYRAGDQINLSVVNSPAHISDEHLPHLFEAFYRADDLAEHGSGLGLYITRMILEISQADYSIENTPDGVEFVVRFAHRI